MGLWEMSSNSAVYARALAQQQRVYMNATPFGIDNSRLVFKDDPDRDYSAKVSIGEQYPLTFYAALKQEINEWLDIGES